VIVTRDAMTGTSVAPLICRQSNLPEESFMNGLIFMFITLAVVVFLWTVS
jgi:hypothetical protein